MSLNVDDISIVMPCYNEEQAIPTLVPRTLAALERLVLDGQITKYELIVVNDRSTDNSVELLSRYPNIKVVHTSEGKRGYGKALKLGFFHAQNQWIGFLDVDNSYRPEDLPKLIDAVHESQSDFVMGARGLNEKGMSFTRGLGNWLYVFLSRVCYGSRLQDVCSGYRIFHRKHLTEVLSIPENGLDFSIHLTLNMLTKNVSIRQIPIQYDTRLGDSKLSVIADGWAFLKVILTLKLRRLRAFKHSRV